MTDPEIDRLFNNLYWDAPLRGSVYKHYKGGLYVVICSCLNESNKQQLIIYRDLATGNTWCRPVKEWDELVEIEGKKVQRFERQHHTLHVVL